MPINIKPTYTSTFFTALCYGIGLYTIQIFLYKCGMLPFFPERSSLTNWDSIFYYSIAHEGYSYNNWVSNTGFCPMFPWIWQLSHLGIYGICLLNIGFFALGFSLLCRLLNLTTTEQWLWLSTPSLYFAFIPYPEALFFLFITVALYGVQYNKRYLVWIALCCSALTRMNIVCLVPTFILAEIITNEPKRWLHSIGVAFLNYCIPLLTGLIIFVLYQYKTTGVWFAYFIKQRDIWQRVFSLPKLPFQVATGPATLWINALALFISLLALVVICTAFINWAKNTKQVNKLHVLSGFYLFFSALLIVFYNPKWGGSGTTNAIGAHRYILVSPFFFIFLQYITNNKSYKLLHFTYVLIAANIFWLAFGSYLHIQELLFFNFNTLILLCYMAVANKTMAWPAIVLIAINVLLQIMLMQRFLGNLSID